MPTKLASFLSQEAGITPTARVDTLLSALNEHWIEDVAMLEKCLPMLEKHLPAAAHHAISVALERRRRSTLSRTDTSDTLSMPVTPTSCSKHPPHLAATSIKLLTPVDELGARSTTQQLQLRTLEQSMQPPLSLDGHSSQPTDAFARQVKAHRKQLSRMYRCTLMPNARFTRRWDALLVVVLLFVATVTPFEVGFLSMELNSLFYVNRAVDCIFICDIVLNFFIAYREDVDRGAGWVFDNRRIALHYLCTWFALDAVSAVPLDSLLLALEASGVYEPSGVWRLLRLTRLVKLLRIVRLSRIFARWQASIGLSYAVASLIQFLVLTLMMAHWLACLWGWVGRNSGDGVLSEDAPRDPLNQSWIELAGFVPLFDEGAIHGTSLAGAFRLYGASLYVSLNNIFGGSCELHPANYVEYYAQCLMMLVGSSIWAFVIGSGCGIIATLNPERIEYRQTMDQVNYFAKSRRLPPHLTFKLRSFFHSTQRIFHAKRFDALLEKMSGSLRADVCTHVARAVLAKVPYFKESEVEADFLASVALALKPRVYCPREHVRTDELVIVERGVCVRAGKIFVKGMCVGEDMIVSRPAFRDGAPAIALSFLQVSTLEKSSLDDLLVSYPCARKAVRQAAVRIATRKAFIAAAAHIRGAQEDGTASQRSSRPPSSVRPERVLLAVAPMQTIIAEREKDSEQRLDDARGGVLARRLLDQWGGTDERLLFIERRTEEMTRSQQQLETKIDQMGDSLLDEIRAMARAAALPGGGGDGQSHALAAGVASLAKVTSAADQAARTSVGAEGQSAPLIRRRVNKGGSRASPCRPPARHSPASASKSLAPSMRRACAVRVATSETAAPPDAESADALEA